MTDFAALKALFDLPPGIVYLDGNSLGPLPKSVPERVTRTLTHEWGGQLITAWNKAGWMDLPLALGDRIGRLIGAPSGTVTVGDTLSIKVYQALAAALALRADRKVIVSDSGNFPTDLYMAEGLVRSMGQGHELRIVPPDQVAEALTDEVAVLMLTEVDYRTGRRHNMQALTAKAHEVGALALWDLAHSTGALDVDLSGADVDFAVGCTYKYLNAGPGAPAFIYVPPHHAHVQPALSGWLGHEAPFAFEQSYRPAPGIARMRVGTPAILQMAALDAALDIFDLVTMAELRARAITLSERFIAAVLSACPSLELASPRDPQLRGSQVSFHHRDGYPVMQALIARGVIGDFRAPDILRFGITPLYLGEADIDRAATILAEILDQQLWDRPEFHQRATVT